MDNISASSYIEPNIDALVQNSIDYIVFLQANPQELERDPNGISRNIEHLELKRSESALADNYLKSL